MCSFGLNAPCLSRCALHPVEYLSHFTSVTIISLDCKGVVRIIIQSSCQCAMRLLLTTRASSMPWLHGVNCDTVTNESAISCMSLQTAMQILQVSRDHTQVSDLSWPSLCRQTWDRGDRQTNTHQHCLLRPPPYHQ